MGKRPSADERDSGVSACDRWSCQCCHGNPGGHYTSLAGSELNLTGLISLFCCLASSILHKSIFLSNIQRSPATRHVTVTASPITPHLLYIHSVPKGTSVMILESQREVERNEEGLGTEMPFKRKWTWAQLPSKVVVQEQVCVCVCFLFWHQQPTIYYPARQLLMLLNRSRSTLM